MHRPGNASVRLERRVLVSGWGPPVRPASSLGSLLLVSSASNNCRVHPTWVMELVSARSIIGIGQFHVMASGR